MRVWGELPNRRSHVRRSGFGVARVNKRDQATVAFAPVTDTPFSLPLFGLASVGVALDVAPVTNGKRLRNIGALRLESTALFFHSGLPALFCSGALLFLTHTAVFAGTPIT
jgi:hypothetical protein